MYRKFWVNDIMKSIPLLAAAVLAASYAPSARAETKQQEKLRTDEAQTPEPMTDQPLKAAMQNLFLQEDPFPQQHLQLQAGLRVLALELNDEPGLGLSAGGEFGVADSWTVALRAPVSFLPSDERGLGNPELGLFYCPWVSKHEDFRLSLNLRNEFPAPSRAGQNAFGHDLSAIAYARWAPLHVQVVATLDVSYGEDMPALRARPEASAAAIVKLEHFSFVLEGAAQREFLEVRYIGALGAFWYPDSFEIGLATTLDVTNNPLTVGAIAIVTYAFDPPK